MTSLWYFHAHSGAASVRGKLDPKPLHRPEGVVRTASRGWRECAQPRYSGTPRDTESEEFHAGQRRKRKDRGHSVVTEHYGGGGEVSFGKELSRFEALVRVGEASETNVKKGQVLTLKVGANVNGVFQNSSSSTLSPWFSLVNLGSFQPQSGD